MPQKGQRKTIKRCRGDVENVKQKNDEGKGRKLNEVMKSPVRSRQPKNQLSGQQRNSTKQADELIEVETVSEDCNNNATAINTSKQQINLNISRSVKNDRSRSRSRSRQRSHSKERNNVNLMSQNKPSKDKEVDPQVPDGIQVTINNDCDDEMHGDDEIDDLLDYDDELSETSSQLNDFTNQNELEDSEVVFATPTSDKNKRQPKSVVCVPATCNSDFKNLMTDDVRANPTLMKLLNQIMDENKKDKDKTNTIQQDSASPLLRGVKSPSDTTIYAPALV